MRVRLELIMQVERGRKAVRAVKGGVNRDFACNYNRHCPQKNAGVGFIGAGITNPPIDCFEKAVLEVAKRI
jgi:hypothetical protein